VGCGDRGPGADRGGVRPAQLPAGRRGNENFRMFWQKKLKYLLSVEIFVETFEIFGNLKYFLRDLKCFPNLKILIFGNLETFQKSKFLNPEILPKSNPKP